MARSVLERVGTVGTLVFALPAAFLGVEFLVGGRRLAGTALVTVAVLMLVVERYLLTPGDLPAMLVEDVVGRLLPSEED